MTWFSGIMIYVLLWWVVLFTVLPWGNRPLDNPEPGHAPSAPANPRLGLKAAITSAIAGAIWILVFLTMEYGWITLDLGDSS